MTDPKGRGKTCEPDVKAIEPVAWAFDRPETPYQFWTTNPEADNLKREKLIPLIRLDAAKAIISQLTAELDAAVADDDETYEIGKRDGYEEAVQDIDQLTGGDGEYRYCTNGDPDRHTPDAETMKRRIADRFETLNTLESLSEIKELQAKLEAAEKRAKELEEGRDLDKVVLDEGIEIINELEPSNKLLSERVAVLEKERDAAHAGMKRQQDAGYCDANWLSDGPPYRCGWQHRAETAERRIAALEGSLEPFAKAMEKARDGYAKRYGKHIDIGYGNFDRMPGEWTMDTITFTMGDLRRAWASLKKEVSE